MSSRKWKLPRARVVALAVGIGAVGSLATAPASFAAGAGPKPPAIGQNCQTDGKINGAGSTFQTNGVNNAFTYGFQQDVCGPQPNSSNLNAAYGTSDPSIFSFTVGATTNSVAGMVAYNYGLSGTAGSNGSGAGLLRMSCRTDFFGGTDLPYNTTQLANVQGAPGAQGACTGVNTGAVPPPYGPQTTVGYPNSHDASATMMAFPTAAGAVAMAVNLNGMCTNTNGAGGTTDIPTGLKFTADELNKIWMGTINQWNDPELVTTNPILGGPAGPGLDNCSGNIQRVVRFDNSGTTAITMFTLYGIDSINGNGGADLCGSDVSPQPPVNGTEFTWYNIATGSFPGGTGSNAGHWPQHVTGSSPDCAETINGTTFTAPNPITSGSNGSPTLITTLKATNGGIGYAETGLWGTLPAGVSFVQLQTFADEQTAGNGLGNANPGPDANGGAAFILPGLAASKSNCTLPGAVPTGSSPAAAVGLGSPNWNNTGTFTGATQNPGKQDIAWNLSGAGYPACGLTFDMVYHGVDTESGEVAGSTLITAGGAATPGCVVSTPSPTTTADVTFPATTVPVTSTASYPVSGTINVGGQVVTYTGKDATDFTGVSGGSGLVTSGSTVTFVSTTLAATSSAVGVNGSCQSVAGPLQGSTNDQLRTMYSYFTYVFSPLGQSTSYLPAQTLDPLPAGWLTNLTAGYQQNF